jgi:hypothetical protein
VGPHAQGLDVAGLLRVALIDHEGIGEVPVHPRHPARGDLDPQAAQQAVGGPLHRRAADDGRDRHDRRCRVTDRVAHSRQLEDRADRDHGIARADHDPGGLADRLEDAGARPGRAGGGQVDAFHVVRRAVARQVLLEVHAPAAAELHDGRTRIFRHGEDAARDAERAADLVADLGQARAPRQAQRAVVTDREVAIAESEPGLVAERAEGVDHRRGVALESIAPAAVYAARQRVGDDVDVRADVHAVEAAVVAGIDDDADLLRRCDPHQSGQEARRTDAARQRHPGSGAGGPARPARRPIRAHRPSPVARDARGVP